MQQDKPEDFAIATGEQHSVREFVDLSAKELGITLRWQGEGVEEVGIIESLDTSKDELPGSCPAVGSVIVRVDPRYYRPCEVETLLGDPAKSRKQLGWVPKISFTEMVIEMVSADLEEAKRDKLVQSSGFKTFERHE